MHFAESNCITLENARTLALAKIRSLWSINDDEPSIADAATMDEKFGWVFFYNTKRFHDSGNDLFRLAGNGPVIVDKTTGEVSMLGSAGGVEHQLANYCRTRNLVRKPAPIPMQIRPDDLTGSAIVALLHEHLRCMAEVSPPESRHALNLDGLRQPGISFWTIWSGPDLVGCGALKELDAHHAEVKSMRVAYAFQKQGVASQMLQHLIAEGQRRGYQRLSLETGSMAYFDPARKLYAKHGFTYCGPFGSYKEDPNSVFMTKEL
jgi:putative acetyltransferase